MFQSLRHWTWLLIAAVGLTAAAESRAICADEPAVPSTKSAIQPSPSSSPAQGAKDAAKPSGATAAPSTAGQQGRNPRVLFIVKKNCPQCDEILTRLRRAGGDFENMRAIGWLIGNGPENHVQIIDRDRVPDLAAKLKVTEYPAVACVDNGELVRYFKSGCTTPLDAWTFGFLATGTDLRPPGTVSEAARVETTGSYPLRGNHWSVEGNFNPTRAEVIAHLRGTNHVEHLLPQWHVDSWSLEELKSLHDDLHEKYGPPSSDESGSSSANFQHLKGRGGASGF